MTEYSSFKVGDAVVRRFNNQIYYICHDIDNGKWEFLIDSKKDQALSMCKVCECFSNLRLADDVEIRRGYAEVF